MLSCFTFHYVSITTGSAEPGKIYHSRLYIPLCLYYYQEPLMYVGPTIPFTFHYVSITTQCRV